MEKLIRLKNKLEKIEPFVKRKNLLTCINLELKEKNFIEKPNYSIEKLQNEAKTLIA